jgi:hypothetical protein
MFPNIVPVYFFFSVYETSAEKLEGEAMGREVGIIGITSGFCYPGSCVLSAGWRADLLN